MYTSKLHILSILPFESGPLVSLLLRITAVQTSYSYSMQVRSWGTSAERVRNMLTPLRQKDARINARK